MADFTCPFCSEVNYVCYDLQEEGDKDVISCHACSGEYIVELERLEPIFKTKKLPKLQISDPEVLKAKSFFFEEIYPSPEEVEKTFNLVKFLIANKLDKDIIAAAFIFKHYEAMPYETDMYEENEGSLNEDILDIVSQAINRYVDYRGHEMEIIRLYVDELRENRIHACILGAASLPFFHHKNVAKLGFIILEHKLVLFPEYKELTGNIRKLIEEME
jgi:hypothetical protein